MRETLVNSGLEVDHHKVTAFIESKESSNLEFSIALLRSHSDRPVEKITHLEHVANKSREINFTATNYKCLIRKSIKKIESQVIPTTPSGLEAPLLLRLSPLPLDMTSFMFARECLT